MNAKDSIKTTLGMGENLLNAFLADLTDADLLVRPVPGANHTAWQLGHLISGEVSILSGNLPGARYPELPAGFHEQHDKATAGIDPPRCFSSKQQYLDLFQKVRGATLSAINNLSEVDLDRPTSGPLTEIAPTLGALLLLAANHVLMHAGQFTVVRRVLGKPHVM